MEPKHRTIVLSGLLIAFGMFLFPPWRGGHYVIIFDPPNYSSGIDVQRLCIQMILLAILCGIAFLATSSKSVSGGSEDTPPKTSLSKTEIKTLTAFVALVLGLGGYHYLQKYQDEQATLAFIKDQELYREKIGKEHEEAAIEATRQRKIQEEQQHKVEEQQRQNFAKKLNKYATHRKLLISEPLYPSVKTYLHSFWRDDKLVYCLSLWGSPEHLEYAADSNQTIQIQVMDRDGLSIFDLNFESSNLKQLKNRAGAVTCLATPREAVPCELATYESIDRVRLHQ